MGPHASTSAACARFHFYYVVGDIGVVWRVAKGGGLPQQIGVLPPPADNSIEQTTGPIAVDDTTFYAGVDYTGFLGGTIFSMPKDGSAPFKELIFTDHAGTMVVDDAGIAGNTSGGPGLRFQLPTALVQDDTYLFTWVSSFGQAPPVWWRFAKDGSSSVVLASGDEAGQSVVGAHVDEHRVWSANPNGVFSVGRKGGPLQRWSDFGPALRGMVGDSDYVYVIFADTDDPVEPARGVARISKDDASYGVISYRDGPTLLAIDGDYLYWTRAVGELVRWSLQ